MVLTQSSSLQDVDFAFGLIIKYGNAALKIMAVQNNRMLKRVSRIK
jgi:hypothetical protein